MAIEYRQYPGMEMLSCTDPFEFKPHIHDRYVVWINTGCGEHFSVKGETDILQPGSLSIFEPGLVHANRPCSDQDRHLRSFYVDQEFFDGLAVQCGRHSFRGFKEKTFIDPDLWDNLAALHQQALSTPDLSMQESRIIETFVSLLVRHGGLKTTPAPHDTCDGRVRKAVDYFHAHLDSAIRLKKLAQMLGCTQFHLIRLFRTHMGMSPHAFLLQLRLEHARRLLEQGRPIAPAAHESGFSDQSHLTRAFKSRYGLTPAAYRKAG